MVIILNVLISCFRYHKGTDFQANHNLFSYDYFNILLFQIPQRYRFSSKSQHPAYLPLAVNVVLDTTKVQIFKQITTGLILLSMSVQLFQIPQRYRFSSKSQQGMPIVEVAHGCFRYHKGTDFQANHNAVRQSARCPGVVLDTTKVQIFKQITTPITNGIVNGQLFQIPQRYRFSSKSQPFDFDFHLQNGCFRYHKGTDFQANHNRIVSPSLLISLFQIPQRYRFSSKSQLPQESITRRLCCFRYHKGTDFQANHNLTLYLCA